ncbi:hypothetical protein [Nostoc sp.]|uniref:hypothetical protein n=1 Tax=Nostoc sp. TaxID=1180 RepID=UPI002FFBC891
MPQLAKAENPNNPILTPIWLEEYLSFFNEPPFQLLERLRQRNVTRTSLVS